MGIEETLAAIHLDVREVKERLAQLEGGGRRPAAEVMRMSEAAGVVGCSKRWLQSEVKAGKLKAHKVGRDYRIRRDDLEEYIERSKVA
ncbi:MAG: helix-turn-helix domain-containing protein [Myxococcota bacterium]